MTIVGTEVMKSAEIDGTGGGDGGAFSFALNSLMNPLFFLATVRVAPVGPDSEEVLGSVGVLCKSTVEAEATCLTFELLPLADLILVQLDCPALGSGVRVDCMAMVAVAVALRERSLA